MSNKTLALLKVMLKTEDVMEMSSNKTGKLKQGLKVIGLGILLLIGGFSFAPMIVEMFKLLTPFGLQDVILKLLLFASSVLVVVFGFFLIMNVFYFSSDVENYLYLPVKPGSLVISKFAVVLFYQILSGLTLFYPSFVVYGILAKADVFFYVKSLLAMVIVPAVPLALIGILTMILMRFSKIFKNKDLFTLVSTGLAVFASIGLSMFIQNFANTPSAGALPPFFTGEGNLYKILSVIFPGTFFMHKAIIGDFTAFLINLLITLGITALVVAAFYVVGNMIYIDGAKGLRETGTKREKLSAKRMSESGRGSNPIFAIAKKELLILVRTPVYFINCVMLSFIMPLFLVMPFIFTPKGGRSNTGDMSLTMLLDMMRSSLQPEWIALIVMITVAFYSSINLIPATSISREGSNFQIMKYLPVSYRTQLMAKILPAFVIQLPAMLLVLIPFIVLFKPSPAAVIIGVIAGLLMSLLVYTASITLDVIKPVLNWTSEQKAVKQNLNAVITTILGMVIAASPIMIAMFTKVNIYLLIGIYAAICLAISAYLLYALPGIAERSFRDR